MVVVTGFGPFGRFPVNASWEVAKGLRNFDFESSGVKLVTEEVKVSYDTVEESVPKLWEMHAPKVRHILKSKKKSLSSVADLGKG